MNYEHFLITQFNLKQFKNSRIEDDQAWIEWTRERIELFKTYCLPSVLNQTNKEFKWFLFFDKSTPEEFVPFLDELREIDFIHVCLMDGSSEFFAEYMARIKESCAPETEWIVTSRMDNDDSISKTTMAEIQRNLVPVHDYLISLASGYVLNTKESTLSHYYYPQSPFLTLIESCRNSPQGVFKERHTEWPELKLKLFKELGIFLSKKRKRKAKFLVKNVNWIQVFHGENVSNSFYRGFPVLRSKKLSDFSLNITTKGQSLRILPKYANYVLWKRYFKCVIVKLFQRKSI